MKQLKYFVFSFITGIFLLCFSQYHNVTGSPVETVVIKNPAIGEWIKTDQDFNAIAIEYLEDQTEVEILLPDEKHPVHMHPDPDDWEQRFSSIFLTPYANRFFIKDSKGDINVHLYNSQKKKPTLFAGSYNIGGIKIISRTEWGADETLRYDYNSNGEVKNEELQVLSARERSCQEKINKYPEEYTYNRVVTSENGNALLWPRQYSKKIQKVVIHHTAESDTSRKIPGSDKIRSIYYYHTVTRGWGDIGYHFIIDQEGNIYEGRSGGDYVVGAHSYCSNINTIGVALMGNFMKNQPSKAQISSLTKLLNGLGKKYQIDLSKTSTFHGEKTENLVGHRNMKATACPGDNLYNILGLFRKYFSVADIDFSISSKPISSSAPAKDFAAELVGKPQIQEIPALQQKTITLSFKNTGRVTWDKTTWLYAANNDNKELWADSIIPNKNYVVANLREDSVRPGRTGNFDISINTGLESGIHTLDITPIINGERKMNGANVLLAIKIPKNKLDYEFVNAVHPQNPFYYGQYQQAKVILKNTGTIPWNRSGNFAISIAPKGNTESPFADTETPKTLAWMEQNIIEPGQVGTFVFDLQAGFRAGIYDLAFEPRIGKDILIKDIGMKFTIQVKKPNYQAQILYDSKDLTFAPGETRTVRLGLRNLSDVDWQENQISLRVIRNGGLTFKTSSFYFPDFIPKTRGGYTNITVTAPLKAGEFQAEFQALANDKKFNKTRWLTLPITVEEPELTGEITYLSQKNFSLKLGRTQDVILRVKNTGNTTWKQKGANAIHLVALTPSSKFKGQKWETDSIVSYMESTTTEPEKVATFRFQIRNNSSEDIKEAFLLRAKSLGTIRGTRFEITNDKLQITNEEPVVIESQKNNETISQKPQTVILSEAKRNEESRNTISSTKKKTSSFLEKIRARREQLKQEFLNKIQERRNQLSSKSKVQSSELSSSEESQTPQLKTLNSIRILLSFPETSANVLSTTSTSKVYVDGKYFKNLKKGDSLWTRKDQDKMIVSINGEKKHGEVIRIESSEYLTLYNWNRSPAWNPNINDNTFEGTLEFRLENGKMITINELDMESYLRGMAEVPEAEPQEKRKAMAVLARSYARHYTETEYRKFSGKVYDGSDSPAVFQKYLGYNYSLRAPKWLNALSETKDEVIVYNDEILRTAYFSCSNGRTKTPDQVGWTQGYYKDVAEVYQSVDDSQGRDLIKYRAGNCGHGVGLSGSGAAALARQGKNYKEILSYYYQGVEVEER